MALDTYLNLQATVLDWLARPGDPLVAPAVPDMIAMFEEEARDRLQSRFTEKTAAITPDANSTTVPLPLDYGQLRAIWIDTANGRRSFTYQTPRNMDQTIPFVGGFPQAYTIEGLNLRFTGDAGDAPQPINILYLSGLPALGPDTPTNWLLTQYPSTYLWGTLSYAAPYIGDDPRAPMWLTQRETAIERIRLADRRAKYPHGLMIQTDVQRGGGQSSGGSGSPAPIMPGPGGDMPLVRTEAPASGATITMETADRSLLITSGPLAALTIVLPPFPLPGIEVDISFVAPVTVLTVQVSPGNGLPTAPHSAYGPGSALVFRFVDSFYGWVYWK